MYEEISGRDVKDGSQPMRDFGNLIGEPVNRYRQDYKDLIKAETAIFRARAKRTPDFEKFTTFYKWFDASLNELVFQLVPASANSSEEIQNLIESHILERNKYWSKFPTLEMKASDPETGIRGINELLYNWKTGHAPISDEQNQNCFWWNERAEREGTISSGDANVDSDRGEVLSATLQVLNRKYSTPHRFDVSRTLNLRGGINLPSNRRVDAFMADLRPSTSETIDVTLDSVPDCLDGANSPTRYGKKIRIPLKAVGGMSTKAKSGDTIAPFSVFSSSAGNTLLAIATDKELTNLHHDGYGNLKEKPLQGPFTEKYVGGLAYRHQALTTPILVPETPATENTANADYLQPLSTGDRTADIVVTTGTSGGAPAWQDTNGNTGGDWEEGLIDGSLVSGNGIQVAGATSTSWADRVWWKVEFASAIVITEAKIYGRVWYGANYGEWQWQGSNDDAVWTNIGSPWAFGDFFDGTAHWETITGLSANATAYKYLRLICSTNPSDTNIGIQFYELDLKIAFPAPAYYRLPNETDREEGFRIKIDNETVSLMQPEKGADGNINLNLPTARYFRDETAKRPLNIRNILQTTGSTIIGNYDKLYQVVQTSNRRTNNQWWIDNNNSETVTARSLTGGDDFSLDGVTIHESISASVFTKPVRGRTPHVITERFSAIGGPDNSGDADGGPGLDALSAEYSPYSTMNYRNLSVRQPMDEFSAERAAQFGVDPDDSTAAAFHKVNRNTLKRIEYSGSTVVTASTYDNLYVQHAIPQSDMGYAWITASAISAPMGFATDPRKLPNADQTITFLSASEINAGSIFVDFAGLNTLFYDPVVAGANIVSASSGEYRNTLFGTLNLVESLNGLSLHRNGPYQYPMWKQTRTGEHPVARNQRNSNTLQYIRPPNLESDRLKRITYALTAPSNPDPDMRHTIPGTPRYPQLRFITRPQRRKTFNEPMITSKYKPMRNNLNMEVGEENPRTFAIKHTYGNNISYFTHEELNNNLIWPLLGNVPGLVLESVPNQIYNDLVELYVDSSTPEESNPIKDFVSLRYSETIYPRITNTFLDRTRSRTNYDVGTILGWRDDRVDRRQLVTANSQGNSLPPYTSSMWPLDGRFTAAGFVSASILAISSSTARNNNLLSGGFGGSGELLNDYTQFHNGDITNIKPAAMYTRRDVEFMSHSGPSANSKDPTPLGTIARHLVAGDAFWEAASQAGKNPFYDTYDDFAKEIKKIGKDFSIVPEFNISDHIDYYVDQGNFFADLPGDVFSLDGAPVSGSSDRTKINNKSFFNLYNSAEFLKHFQVINADHSDEDFAKELTLSCESIMKFRPRDGFYPAQRTLQLATLFSQSYSGEAILAGDQANFRTLLTPFYAPGIMYNTIKSGIAVDYPVMSDSFEIGAVALTTGSDGRQQWSMPFPGGGEYQDDPWYKELGGGPPPLGVASDDSLATSYFISSSFHNRIPFEAILNPARELSRTDVNGDPIRILDAEPHPSASLNSTASYAGAPSSKYQLASHNFFAECASFYLSKKELGSFTSFIAQKPDNRINPTPGKTYKMDVVLTSQLGAGTTGTGIFAGITGGIFSSSIDMYNRAVYGAQGLLGEGTSTANHDLAFGPPCEEAIHNPNAGVRITFWSSAPFTPPYYDGPAKATLEFTARELSNGDVYTVEKIIQELTSLIFKSRYF